MWQRATRHLIGWCCGLRRVPSQTTSGKIARQWGKRALLNGEIDAVALFQLKAAEAVDAGDWGQNAPTSVFLRVGGMPFLHV